MTEVMFDVPSEPDIVQCIIEKACITDGKKPHIVRENVS